MQSGARHTANTLDLRATVASKVWRCRMQP